MLPHLIADSGDVWNLRLYVVQRGGGVGQIFWVYTYTSSSSKTYHFGLLIPSSMPITSHPSPSLMDPDNGQSKRYKTLYQIHFEAIQPPPHSRHTIPSLPTYLHGLVLDQIKHNTNPRGQTDAIFLGFPSSLVLCYIISSSFPIHGPKSPPPTHPRHLRLPLLHTRPSRSHLIVSTPIQVRTTLQTDDPLLGLN